MAKEFYHLTYPSVRDPLYGDPDWYETIRHAEWTEDMDFEQLTCPLHPEKHMRAGDRIGDLHVVLPSPNVPDFLWTWYSECIMTERVRTHLDDAGTTGYEARPVTVGKVKYARKGTTPDIPELWELSVTGRGGDAHPDSGIRVLKKSICEACGFVRHSSYRNGIIVDEKQWDGSDVFTVNGYPKLIIVSEKVKDIVVGNELVNCALVRSRDMVYPQGIRPPEDFYG